MPDVREVAERSRGRRSWSVTEIQQAFPSMSRDLVEKALRGRYGRSAQTHAGPTGWHGAPDMKATHFFVRGWAICGFGTVAVSLGRENDFECPACRNEVERTKVA